MGGSGRNTYLIHRQSRLTVMALMVNWRSFRAQEWDYWRETCRSRTKPTKRVMRQVHSTIAGAGLEPATPAL